MPHDIGEELAYIQGKAAGEIAKQTAKGIKDILESILRQQGLKGGKNNLQAFIDSERQLKEIIVQKENLKVMVEQSKRNKIPIAVINTAKGDYKIVFRLEDTERVENTLKDVIEGKLDKDKTKQSIKQKIKKAQEKLSGLKKCDNKTKDNESKETHKPIEMG